jgi:Rnl2 family RNA ligase
VIPRYPAIPLLKRRPEIFYVREVIACEKLHGSNASIHIAEGVKDRSGIIYGSRETTSLEPNFALKVFQRWCEDRPETLDKILAVCEEYGFSDVTIYGEAYGPGIQAKGVKYTSGKEVLFRAFDIMVSGNLLTYDLFLEVVRKMGLPSTPVIWRGEPSVEAFDKLLNQPSQEALQNGVLDGGNLSEGVVIRSNPLLRNVFGEWLILKHKSAHFSEVAAPSKVEAQAKDTSPGDAFVATFVTPARVASAICRLRDRGVPLSDTLKDIPSVLQEVVLDLQKECLPEWEAAGLTVKDVKGAASKVVVKHFRKINNIINS